ncbi:ketopantoate reductase family protein [Paenibacillus montanisoli]|uniref:2-dehydropantoate 2-reductase n=1 Tax=Paenibacillus montanisoli TaxID=2081970 RepID=A0A328U1Y0_9BACL|nr:2-dehydropantoate 2-reductase [Paenibacillus montanisoli]RAP76670.1 2-dehydropantoate 2-reductase [Paenibacillus montanisoli]
MRIIIVGAGAIGLLYGARLAIAGTDIVMLARKEEQAEQLRKEGIKLTGHGGGQTAVKVSASTIDGYLPAGDERPDWIWLAVKQAHLDETLAGHIGRLGADGSPVLALQNGIGHMDALRKVLQETQLHAAVTTEGALRGDGQTVRHTGRGTLTFGCWPRSVENASKSQNLLLTTLIAAGIEASLSNEMEDVVYHKLLVNAVINPLTAISGVRNGELPADPNRLRWMRALHEESNRILIAAGMAGNQDAWERLLRICEATAGNESSMLRDVKAGRKTEIDWINGGILRLAERLHLPAPMNEAVYTLIKTLHTN